MVTKTAGEMQLGGHDEGSIAPGHDMQFIKTTSTAEYSVPITSMRFGDEELLDFATVINPRVPGRMAWIPGILDSGTYVYPAPLITSSTAEITFAPPPLVPPRQQP